MSEKRAPLRIGIVGSGFFGQHAHLSVYSRLGECVVTAIADHKSDRLRLISDRYRIPHSFSDVGELVRCAEVDAVVVVVNRRQTGRVVQQCLEAGKHVLSEKPMAHTVAQSEALVRLAAAKQLRYIVGFMKRYDAGVRAAKTLLDQITTSGEVGRPTLVRAHCFMGDAYQGAQGHIPTAQLASAPSAEDWDIAPAWIPSELRSDYSWFLNCYSHTINLLRYLLGPIEGVDFSKQTPANGRVMVLRKGDLSVVFEAGRIESSGWNESIEIFFEKGRLLLELPPPLLVNVPARVRVWRTSGQGTCLEEHSVPASWAFTQQAQEFVQSVVQGLPSVSEASDCVADMELTEKIWRRYLDSN